MEKNWIKWLAATIVAAVSMTVSGLSYIGSNYASKEIVQHQLKESKESRIRIYQQLRNINERLSRIEGKLDQ